MKNQKKENLDELTITMSTISEKEQKSYLGGTETNDSESPDGSGSSGNNGQFYTLIEAKSTFSNGGWAGGWISGVGYIPSWYNPTVFLDPMVNQLMNVNDKVKQSSTIINEKTQGATYFGVMGSGGNIDLTYLNANGEPIATYEVDTDGNVTEV